MLHAHLEVILTLFTRARHLFTHAPMFFNQYLPIKTIAQIVGPELTNL